MHLFFTAKSCAEFLLFCYVIAVITFLCYVINADVASIMYVRMLLVLVVIV